MNSYDNNIMDWDSAIESDGAQFIVLPEGDYAFTVTNFERSHYPGSAKLPPCPKATLTLMVELPDGQTATCKEDLMHIGCVLLRVFDLEAAGFCPGGDHSSLCRAEKSSGVCAGARLYSEVSLSPT